MTHTVHLGLDWGYIMCLWSEIIQNQSLLKSRCNIILYKLSCSSALSERLYTNIHIYIRNMKLMRHWDNFLLSVNYYGMMLNWTRENMNWNLAAFCQSGFSEGWTTFRWVTEQQATGKLKQYNEEIHAGYMAIWLIVWLRLITLGFYTMR